jgi:AmmeMemoRadiSam system protein A/AmmeMemoRadiSam system protein B
MFEERGYLLPHPPLAIPAIGGGEEKKIKKTLDSLEVVAREVAVIAPETIIFITPHSTCYGDYFHISPGDRARGAIGEVEFQLEYDKELVYQIARCANEDRILAGDIGEEDASLDHGVMVSAWFINQYYKGYKGVRISVSGMTPEEHYAFGKSIGRAARESGKRVVIIASGDLSHKLLESGDYGYAMEGKLFDQTIVTALTYGDFLPLLFVSDSLREEAAECGFNSCMILAGYYDCKNIKSKVYSYEGPFGVGYVVAGITSKGNNPKRNFLEKHRNIIIENALKVKEEEDVYQSLARQSLEYTVKVKRNMELPKNLPEELIDNQGGVFVSIYKNKRLRGCVGTFVATTENLALEIIQNAVSAGFADNRFDEVRVGELRELTYKVDILSPPEPIDSISKLNPKKYGVIVRSGRKKGLLLPDLEGIDTVEEQVEIAKKKAGITEEESIELERFSVIRHGG